jgi:glutathione S-transferase
MSDTKLYSLALSHPAHAARLMLEHKGIDHDVVNLVPGMHPLILRTRGFSGPTVPALRIGARRIQGSLEISRGLDEIQTEPRLFPSEPDRRRAVEEAEEWGERELQATVRRLFRWSTATRPELRQWIAADLVKMPAPGLAAAANAPVAKWFARAAGATDEKIRADLARLPKLLDRVDELIGEGTIGGAEPNAADFQIGTSVRVLIAFPDLAPAVESRPAGALAQRLLARYPGPFPARFPGEWLAAERAVA